MRRTCAVALGVLSAALASAASAQPVRINVATDGTLANESSLVPTLSRDGRFVAFLSFASNLAPGDTNGVADIFLRDRDTDGDHVFDEPGAVSTVRVSQLGAVQANGPSFHPVITADGRFVFFESAATSFYSLGQPALPYTQILRWDRQSGDIVLVSRNGAGEPLNGRCSWPAPTDDGNVVYFLTDATDGPLPSPGPSGLLVRRDIAAGTSTVVAVGSSGPLERPSVSGDGRVVAYAGPSPDPATRAVWVQVAGQPERLFPGRFGQVSHDGAFLSGILYTGDAGGPAFRIHLPTGERRLAGDTNLFSVSGAYGASPSGRFVQGSTAFFADFDYAFWTANFFSHEVVAFDGLDQWLIFTRPDGSSQRNFVDLFATTVAAYFDNDEDGLNDHWELLFGLSPFTSNGSIGDNGPGGDPDGDGVTNAQEFARGTNPVGNLKRFLAEGTSSADFFSTRIAIVNPGSVEAKVAVRFDAGDGVGVSRAMRVPARTRVTLDSHAESMDGFSFSTVVDGDQPLVVDRLVTWGTAAQGIYGSHAETSSASPGTAWFLAEGSTVLGFQLFYLLQNPQTTATTATIRFLLPSGAPIVRTYQLAPQSRTTVYVNTVPGLESTDVSGDITATQPIFVERAMYRSTPTQTFALGHDAAAVASPATTWLFAEGASNAFFDTYLLLANPGATPATVDVAYLQDSGGPLTRTYTVAAGARFSVYVNDVPGLSANSYGIRVTSTAPIVAERAMYWADGFFNYYEGHVSAGATAPGSRWVLAESELTATPTAAFQAVPFVLIANTGNAPLSYRLRTIPEAGGTVRDAGVATLAAGARFTFPMSLIQASGRFGVEVVEEGTSTGALIVEGAMYWSVNGVPFAAGASWPATRMAP